MKKSCETALYQDLVDLFNFEAARWLGTELHLIKGESMMADDQRCFAKAQARGDETFTLVGQDLSSPVVICEWIKQNIMTCPNDQKLRDALNDAIRMKNLPLEQRKVAD